METAVTWSDIRWKEINWDDIRAKFKRRLSKQDVERIATRMARPAISMAPMDHYIEQIQEQDTTLPVFPDEWRQQLSDVLQHISSVGGRKAQALQCRCELLPITETVEVTKCLLKCSDDVFHEFWLPLRYVENGDLDKQQLRALLIREHAFALLASIGVSGLHYQQFNKIVDIDSVLDPYKAICMLSAELELKTGFASAMVELGRPELGIVGSGYLEVVSKPLLHKVIRVKKRYAAWIKDGNTNEIAPFREQFLALGDAHTTAMETL